MIQLFCPRYCAAHSKATNKKVEAEPDKKPIKTQMKIHLRECSMIVFIFSKFIRVNSGVALTNFG
jgi:hypothetical protein